MRPTALVPKWAVANVKTFIALISSHGSSYSPICDHGELRWTGSSENEWPRP
ncbi:hypothetical protein L6E12_11180 [Actinokineospora sp. PR83]|uniref:hypothetical protein n=1 Tax=Actinokineospora sp. PR83 TaxID=2884908 RepID=UPI001F391E47|nr:hypothetical protein [Actinokineospora sp. PR83]MCG8916352.1 hypothetical protein [Actinokineospora sp. PR83]